MMMISCETVGGTLTITASTRLATNDLLNYPLLNKLKKHS
jgi:hypothetical protein